MAATLKSNDLQASLRQYCDVQMDVVVHDSIASTNGWALQQSKAGRALPFACFAESQECGRGRRGKQWLMPAGSNIAMSLAWSYDLPFSQMNLLPLSIALAIAETIEATGVEQVQIKWPNDVYVRGRKIAGILIETQPRKDVSGGSCLAVVIGIGLNFDMRSLSQEQRQTLPAFTDLLTEYGQRAGGERVTREGLATMLLQHTVDLCGRFLHDAAVNLEKFRHHYDYCKDKPVCLRLDDGQLVEGVACGVDDNAELLVLVDDRVCSFNSADVSVKTVSQMAVHQADMSKEAG